MTILLDEMRIKEDIVYDKTTENVIGFCNLGSINDDLMRCECAEGSHPICFFGYHGPWAPLQVILFNFLGEHTVALMLKDEHVHRSKLIMI